ncbi:MAG: putative quinol monooxygenase, partial [Nocardioides sp.]
RTVDAISSDEPGTISYTVHSQVDAEDTRIFYELYEDEAALAAHEAQPVTAAFLQSRDQYVESYTVVRLTPIMGKGIEISD